MKKINKKVKKIEDSIIFILNVFISCAMMFFNFAVFLIFSIVMYLNFIDDGDIGFSMLLLFFQMLNVIMFSYSYMKLFDKK